MDNLFVTLSQSLPFRLLLGQLAHQSYYRGADKSLARSDWKNNWKVAIFRSTRRSLLLRRPGWTEKLLNFFWVAWKGYEFGRCSYSYSCSYSDLSIVFQSGWAKDLSAPRYFLVRWHFCCMQIDSWFPMWKTNCDYIRFQIRNLFFFKSGPTYCIFPTRN